MNTRDPPVWPDPLGKRLASLTLDDLLGSAVPVPGALSEETPLAELAQFRLCTNSYSTVPANDEFYWVGA